MFRSRFWLVVFCFGISSAAWAQAPQKAAPAKPAEPLAVLPRHRLAHFVTVGLAGGIPVGSIKQDYGAHGLISAGYTLRLPSLWTLGVEAGFIYGSTVKKDPLSNLRTVDGYVIGQDGANANFTIDEQGFAGPGLFLGRMIVLPYRTGHRRWEHALLPQVGPAFLFYKTHIQDLGRTVPLLNKEGRKGFDRLRGGLGPAIKLAYWIQSRNGRFAVFAEPHLYLAKTYPLRSFDYNLGQKPTGTRWDGIFGIRIGFALTFFNLDEKEEFFY